MKQKKILALLFVGVLMGALDISIVGPAIPSIEKTIDVATKDIGWIFSIYVLFNLVGISLFAKLSDLFGRRSIYMLSLALFAIGSLVVAIADNFEVLLIGRSIQGFGSSGIFPVASAVIGDIFPQEKRGRSLGLIGAVWGIAFIIGPVIAGALLSFFPWHVLFLINIPIALVLIVFSYKLLPSRSSTEDIRLDWSGILLMSCMLASFTFGMNHIDPDKFFKSAESAQVWPFLLASIVLLFFLVLNERKVDDPVINTNLFYSSQIRIVSVIAITTGAFQSVFVFIPDFTVNAFNITPAKASFMLLPFVLATAIGSPLFGRLIDKIGSKLVIITGVVFSIIGLAMLGYKGDVRHYFYIGGAFSGLGMSVFAGSALRYIMLNEVSARERAATQGIITVFTSIGQISGATLIGAIIASEAVRMNGYEISFFDLAGLFVLILFVSLLLKSRAQEKADNGVEVKA